MTRIALLPWGNVLEDFLDSIGVDFEAFRRDMTGGWLFGYVEALKTADIDTVIVCVSARTRPGRYVHEPTGATIRVLRVPLSYRVLRMPMRNPYGYTLEESYGRPDGAHMRGRYLRGLVRDLAPYRATPIGGLVRVLRAEDCRVLLCQEYEYARFDASMLAGRIARVPVYATFQGGSGHDGQIADWVRPRTIAACAGLIIASAVERERVEGTYDIPATRIATIPNPIDRRLWYPEDRRKARAAAAIDPDARCVIWHGRVDLRRKGLDILIEAWSRIEAERTQGRERLLLIGTGDDADRLQALIAERGLRRVTWRNEYVLDRAVMRGYLNAADVSVLPSRHEGFAVAPVEAMACGLPVVAADAPGVRDVLVEGEASGGIVVPREDPDALARALTRLLDDDELRETLGWNGLARVEREFSLEAVGTQLRNVLLPATDWRTITNSR